MPDMRRKCQSERLEMASALALQHISNSWVLGARCSGSHLPRGIFGFVNGVLTLRLGIPSFLVILGMLGIARGIALLITDTRPVIIANRPYFSICGNSSTLDVSIAVGWTIVIVALGFLLLQQSLFGLRVFATGGNPQAARFTGVKTHCTVIRSFVLTGALVGEASLLFTAMAHAPRPAVGVGLELDVIAASLSQR